MVSYNFKHYPSVVLHYIHIFHHQISVNNVMVSHGTIVFNNMVSIVVGNLNLTKGTDYEVSVTATNSIGTSGPVTGTLSVPS